MMSEKKIIFMGTPDISSIYLNSLIEKKYNIVGVYSQPPRKKNRGMLISQSPVQKLALLNNIKTFTPLNFKNNKTLIEIKSLKPDIIIVMGYGLKLPNLILDLPRLGCINLHVSLLPRWRGAAPIEYSLLNGDLKTGITIFKLVEEMDAGPIIASETIIIDKNINKGDLINNLNVIGTKLLISKLPDIFNQKIVYRKQDKKEITYANKINTDTRKLDFNENIEIIKNKIRAFSPQPSAWFFYKKERIKIIKSSFVKGDWNSSMIIDNKFNIGCKDGKVCPEIIQREGKKPMHLDDFLKGFKFKINTEVNA